MLERASSDTRCRILSAAERLFRDIGYRKTTVADIAKALAMSPANVYRFFSSKKAINEAVAERCVAEIDAALAAIAAGEGSATQRMRDLLATMHSTVAEYGDADAKIYEMVEVAMAESWGVVRAHIERMDGILTELVRQGIAAGEFTATSPEVAGPCIRAAMMRFCNPMVLRQCGEIPTPTLDQQIDFVLAAIGARR
ncbi:TetR/AcrR family transcriptional regulator [Chelatococcus sp. GCM10030263]|uniref:TetR/AcrR family transcriptional regulator n=1 Tax=Chelatococcus sp. GCM10030263 TaxID=3273387 RepID=UPI003607A2E0